MTNYTTTCGACMGSGHQGHPDSGLLCALCGGAGAAPDTIPRAEAEADASERSIVEQLAGLDPELCRMIDKVYHDRAEAMVEAALREAADLVRLNSESQHWSTLILALIHSGPSALDRVVAEAEARGRERAAKIAETRWKVWHTTEGNCGVECDATACEEIAAAIRAQGET